VDGRGSEDLKSIRGVRGRVGLPATEVGGKRKIFTLGTREMGITVVKKGGTKRGGVSVKEGTIQRVRTGKSKLTPGVQFRWGV